MAIYFEPQDRNKSFLSEFGQGLQPILQHMLQNQTMQNRNTMNQENRVVANDMQNQNYQNRLNENREYKTGMLDRTFGSNIQGAGRDNQGSIQIDGQMNPQSTGLTQQMLNKLKLEAQTGVNVPKQQQPHNLGYSMNTKDGVTNVLNKGTGELSQTGEYSPQIKQQLTQLGKVFDEMKSYPKGSPQYKAYVAYTDYITTGRISPELQMMMQMMGGGNTSGQQIKQTTGNSYGFLPTESNTTKVPQGSMIQNYMNK